jgi:hypothetical protein
VSVWDDIERMTAQHAVDLEATRRAVQARSGGAVRCRHGLWWCSWRPTRGDRTTKRVSGRTPAELLQRLDALVRDWPGIARPRKSEGSADAA